MAKLYYKKIKNEEIHPITNEPWNINDVPERWKDEVLALLEGSADGQ